MNTFDAETFRTLVEKIVINGDTLEFHLYDGTRKDIEDVKRRHYTGSK